MATVLLGEMRKKGQITIPKQIVDALNLKEGEKLEFTISGDAIKIRPVVVIPKSQAWYWTPEWQAAEREADEDIAAGRYKTTDSLNELLQDLED